jgi:hypothetical protein
MANEIELPNLYAIRNKEEKWFRRKGYGGSGETWVNELKKARIYTKPGPARAQISFFANKYPSYGIPDLVMFKCTEMIIMDETERIEKQKRKQDLFIQKQALREKELNLRVARETFDRAQKALEDAQKDSGITVPSNGRRKILV